MPGASWPGRSRVIRTSGRCYSRSPAGVSASPRRLLLYSSPLDLILVRKIGVPLQPELAMGAVVDGAAPIIVRNEDIIERAYRRIHV
jgi:putative phosphoribosyl transferase